MSFSNSSGGTLTVPSPTHAHHVDVLATSVRSLRRSLSRSPSKFRLVRTNSQGSDSSQSSHSPGEQSPCRRLTPVTRSQTPVQATATPATLADPSGNLSTTPLNCPPASSSNFSPSTKLSLRSAKSLKQAPTPTRSLLRPRVSPKSPLKRALSATSESENPAPPSSPPPATGQENTASTTPRSPAPRSSLPRRPLEKSSRHSLHLDVSGSSHQAIFRALEGNGDMMSKGTRDASTAASGALKRSDAIMDLDQPNTNSPVAKRRSLHGISNLGYGETDINIFGAAAPSSQDFEIHDDTANREYELFGGGYVATSPREAPPHPTPSTPSVPRRTGSLRKSTLQQRQHDRSSWGRRSGANHLAQMSGDSSTPNIKNRPRLSMDQFLPPQLARDSPFTSNGPLPNPSLHQIERADRSSHQPHPLSKTLTTSSSGSSLEEKAQDNTAPAPVVFAKPTAPVNFTKSLPYGAGQPLHKEDNNVTPFKDVKPWAGAFMSTGLISKVNRNPEEDQKPIMPDTPCKKPTHGFATYPPPQGSAMKRRNNRPSFGAAPATPFNTSPTQSRSIFGTNAGKGLSIFERISQRQTRRGSLLNLDKEDKKPSLGNNATGPLGADIPPTPTKLSISTPILGDCTSQDISCESPSAHRTSFQLSAVRPGISREATASPVEEHAPKTPQANVVIPDASHLSISNPADNEFTQSRAQGIAVPSTPSGRDSFFGGAAQLMTPANGRSNGDIDDSLYSRFDKVELVGKGEFSSVYRVVKSTSLRASFLSVFSGTPTKTSPGSPEPDRIYAVKKARRPFLGPKDRENKLREVRALQALTHSDHVIHYVDSWENDFHLFIQTEFCDEGSLDKFLGNIGRKGRLDDFRIWKVVHDISLGLQSIHDAGFMHLDLKPANILITFEGILKIGDFGLATPWPATKGVDAEGDREYIGPEILRGEFDKPADVFALGLMLVEMACNVVLPDNGPTWIALRSGDFSEVPSLTSSTTAATQIRDAAGVPTWQSHEDSLIEQTSAPDISIRPDSQLKEHSFSGRSDHLGSPKRSELQTPPDFMCDIFHPNSLDQMARWMTKPNPSDRPTIHQLLEAGSMAWVADRRRSAATVFEGAWGPSDLVRSADEDTEMTGI